VREDAAGMFAHVEMLETAVLGSACSLRAKMLTAAGREDWIHRPWLMWLHYCSMPCLCNQANKLQYADHIPLCQILVSRGEAWGGLKLPLQMARIASH
jgi:hypothetical protein